MKQTTQKDHNENINRVLYTIFKDLSHPFKIEELAKISTYSSFHFQKIFKNIVGESVISYIKKARLEWSGNLLIFNPNSTITEIANSCGFASSATFTNEFKNHFNTTPSKWRKGDSKDYKDLCSKKSSDQLKSILYSEKKLPIPTVEIKSINPIKVAYIRHIGYNKTIKKPWQKLLSFLDYKYKIKAPTMIGLYHSNPDITPLEECRYVACVKIEKKIFPTNEIGVMEIPGGLYGCCSFQGSYGDIIHLYRTLYYSWLGESSYRARNTPPFAIYNNNHFLDDGVVDVEFFIPLEY
ncbi:MAG: AraC family transcriptional regulator [Campylobacterales bacterium]|nr:AraC family transcriptional regulator [Campylobacterales bacterium]